MNPSSKAPSKEAYVTVIGIALVSLYLIGLFIRGALFTRGPFDPGRVPYVAAGCVLLLLDWSIVVGMVRGPRHAAAVWLGWMVPGLGHALIGHPKKAAIFFAIIATAFGIGLWLTSGHTVAFEDQPFYFVGQFGSGLTMLLHSVLGAHKAHPNAALPVSWFDPGMLYTATAGLLNLVLVLNLYRPPPPPPVPETEETPETAKKPQYECAEAGSALFIAITGFFIFGIFLGPIAILKGLRAKRSIARDPSMGGADKATAGIIIGVFDVVVWVAVITYLAAATKWKL